MIFVKHREQRLLVDSRLLLCFYKRLCCAVVTESLALVHSAELDEYGIIVCRCGIRCLSKVNDLSGISRCDEIDIINLVLDYWICVCREHDPHSIRQCYSVHDVTCLFNHFTECIRCHCVIQCDRLFSNRAVVVESQPGIEFYYWPLGPVVLV